MTYALSGLNFRTKIYTLLFGGRTLTVVFQSSSDQAKPAAKLFRQLSETLATTGD